MYLLPKSNDNFLHTASDDFTKVVWDNLQNDLEAVKNPMDKCHTNSSPKPDCKSPKKQGPHKSNHEDHPKVLEFINRVQHLHTDEYVVTTQPLEECPMCYMEFKPEDFTFNVYTGVFTSQCNDCALYVYLIPYLHDSFLHIATDNFTKLMWDNVM